MEQPKLRAPTRAKRGGATRPSNTGVVGSNTGVV